MISILASPKAFSPAFASIQDRAIESWKRLHAEVEVILYGKDEGIDDAASRHGCHHVSGIPCSQSGAPLFNAIADHASHHARFDLQMYINADIILPPELLHRIAPVTFPRFLIVGQRIDLAHGVEFDASVADWVAELRRLHLAGMASLHAVSGVDYFIFRRGLWHGLKPLIVGRAGYDANLVAYCLRQGIPVIDATLALLALHQYHDYSHLSGGSDETFHGQEAEQNRRLHDLRRNGVDVGDASWILRCNELRRHACRGDALRQLELTLRFRCQVGLAWMAMRALWRLIEATGLRRRYPLRLDEVLVAHAAGCLRQYVSNKTGTCEE